MSKNQQQKPFLFYGTTKFELENEELERVKNAINNRFPTIDLVRGEKRIKLNLTNFIYLES